MAAAGVVVAVDEEVAAAVVEKLHEEGDLARGPAAVAPGQQRHPGLVVQLERHLGRQEVPRGDDAPEHLFARRDRRRGINTAYRRRI